jgi:hypothetical protein
MVASNFDRITANPAFETSWEFSVPTEKCWESTYIKPQQIRSESFNNHHSLTIHNSTQSIIIIIIIISSSSSSSSSS